MLYSNSDKISGIGSDWRDFAINRLGDTNGGSRCRPDHGVVATDAELGSYLEIQLRCSALKTSSLDWYS